MLTVTPYMRSRRVVAVGIRKMPLFAAAKDVVRGLSSFFATLVGFNVGVDAMHLQSTLDTLTTSRSVTNTQAFRRHT